METSNSTLQEIQELMLEHELLPRIVVLDQVISLDSSVESLNDVLDHCLSETETKFDYGYTLLGLLAGTPGFLLSPVVGITTSIGGALVGANVKKLRSSSNVDNERLLDSRWWPCWLSNGLVLGDQDQEDSDGYRPRLVFRRLSPSETCER